EAGQSRKFGPLVGLGERVRLVGEAGARTELDREATAGIVEKPATVGRVEVDVFPSMERGRDNGAQQGSERRSSNRACNDARATLVGIVRRCHRQHSSALKTTAPVMAPRS